MHTGKAQCRQLRLTYHQHPTLAMTRTPIITRMQVIPVAGHDSMLLNLSGAHAPFFTRNLVVLTDSSGATGVGEERSEERRVGKECDRVCRSRWSPYH